MRCGAVKERKEKKKSDVCVMYSQHSVMRNRYTDLADREHYCIARACLKIKNCTKHVFLSPFHDRIKKKGAFICQDVMN